MSVNLFEVKGFTPVMDVVVQDVGLMEALVYGVVWRYCKRSNGVCQASLKTIAGEVGLNRRTVLRHIKKLCDHGYIEDTTPDLRNRPHTYRDTGKVRIEGLLEAVTESHTKAGGVTESHSGSDRESPLGVTESHLKILDTEKIHIDSASPDPDMVVDSEDDKVDKRAWFTVLADTCSIDISVATTKQKNQLGQSAKLLREKAGATLADIAHFREWWDAHDWRGARGQPPSPAQVREVWGQYKAAVGNGHDVVKVGR